MAVDGTLIFIVVLLLVVFPVSLPIPFVLLHGFNDHCEGGMTTLTQNLSTLSGYYGRCIEIGNGEMDSMFMPIPAQRDIVCEQVKRDDNLKNGFDLVGLSQGGIIARSVLEFCPDIPPVRNFVSVGGPQAGIASIPNCAGDTVKCKLINNILKLGVYTDMVQSHLAPAGYIKYPDQIENYLKHSWVLPYLNNEARDDKDIALRKERFSALKNLVLIKFDNDTEIIPKESAWFGFYQNGDNQTLLPAQQTPLYTEDWIGLQTLDKAGKVHYFQMPGGHLDLTLQGIENYIVPFLKN